MPGGVYPGVYPPALLGELERHLARRARIKERKTTEASMAIPGVWGIISPNECLRKVSWKLACPG